MFDSPTGDNAPSETSATPVNNDIPQLNINHSVPSKGQYHQHNNLRCKRAAAFGDQITQKGKKLLGAVGNLSPNKSPNKNLDQEAMRCWHR